MDTFKNGIGQTVNSGQISMEVKPFERQHGILNQERGGRVRANSEDLIREARKI